MSILKCILLSLVLFMLSCDNATQGIKKVEDTNITTFEMKDTLSNAPIGRRSMGKAKSGERLEDRFAVKNGTNRPMIILDAKTNCGCVTVDYSKDPIKVGEQKTMKYTYDSRGKIGQQFSEITIKTNVGEYKVLIDLLVE